MGKDNRARRKAKQNARRRARNSSQGHQQARHRHDDHWRPSSESGLSQAEYVAGLFDLAPQRLALGDQQFVDQIVGTLVKLPVGVIRRGAANELIGTVVAISGGGWQPAEVVRQAHRACGAVAADVIGATFAAEHELAGSVTIDSRWQAQLDELNPPDVSKPLLGRWLGDVASAASLDIEGEIRLVFEVIRALRMLPRVAELIPPPGTEWPNARLSDHHSDADRAVLDKVRAMLVKAESTTFEAEAEAFTAKAHELMTRHAIDSAMLDGADDEAGEVPITIRLAIDDPYADAKSLLLQVVAEAGRCRAVVHTGLGMSSVVGFNADVLAVDMLYTSLLVQAQSALSAAGKRAAPGSRPRSRSYRSAFLIAYANRIGQRLAEINDVVVAEARAATGREVLPVLHSRDDIVDRAVDAQFSGLTSQHVRGGHDAAGWAGGRLAADAAQLSFGDLGSPQ